MHITDRIIKDKNISGSYKYSSLVGILVVFLRIMLPIQYKTLAKRIIEINDNKRSNILYTNILIEFLIVRNLFAFSNKNVLLTSLAWQ